jgi:hypothetical protein
LLTRAWERVPQGHATKLILSPIDFSDLSTEYIGILYEGLLDFQLRRADAPIVFLNLGDQPALPFLQLDAMPVDEIAKLFEKFKVAEKKGESGEDDAEEAEEAPEEHSPEPVSEDGEALAEVVIEEDLTETGDASEDREQLRQRIHTWARHAAEAATLVKKPKGKPSPEKQRAYDEDLDKAARSLVPRIIFPGEWFLVREGNTRKGSGTFYTRPQLAGPITRRALRELAYEGDVPRTPEQILALKVCDPACGSSPDGRSILCTDVPNRLVALVPLAELDKPQNIRTTPYQEYAFHLSPDGTHVVYVSAEAEASGIYVASFPSFAEKRKVSIGPGRLPTWGRNGKSVFYLSGDGLVEAQVQTAPHIQIGERLPLFKLGGVGPQRFASTADGQRFLIMDPIQQQDLSSADLVLMVDWPSELRRQ